jgi:hypothetical protein
VRLVLGVYFGLIALGNAYAESCSSDFREFFGRFASDRAFQQANIRYPLTYSIQGNGICMPDCPNIKTPLTQANIAQRESPIFPLDTIRLEKAIERRIIVRKRHVEVSAFSLQSGSYNVVFRFSRVKGCWKLTYVEDWSL